MKLEMIIVAESDDPVMLEAFVAGIQGVLRTVPSRGIRVDQLESKYRIYEDEKEITKN